MQTFFVKSYDVKAKRTGVQNALDDEEGNIWQALALTSPCGDGVAEGERSAHV
jgi:hypothetical protein